MRAIALAALLTVAVLLTACTAEPSPTAAPVAQEPAAPLVVPTGYAVSLDHQEKPVTGPDGQPMVEWTSAWTLSWQPVPAAASYVVRFGTSEGRTGKVPGRTVTVPSVQIDVAAGTSAPERLEQDRRAGLLFTSSQLLVSVAAVGAKGTEGPRSPWFPVGDVPPDGKPIDAAAG